MQYIALKRLSLLGTLAASLVAFTPLGYAAGKDDNVVIPEDCLDALKKWKQADKTDDNEFKQAMKTCEGADKEEEKEKKLKLLKSCNDKMKKWETSDKKEDSQISEIIDKCKFDK